MQDYTQEFRKGSLMLGVDLQSQDMLLKYIGRLHSYLRHTILMFNPNNLDEVCVQATHLECKDSGHHISPQWYDIVHFGPKPSWICFWALPQNASYQWRYLSILIYP